MSDIKVTQTEIDLLLNSADVQVRTEFGKCTVVTVRLRNGFILTESSACVDPANYDAELRCGWPVRRRGWNGKGIFIKLQVPDEHSKMTSPYIYIDTTGLRSNNPDAPRSCVPWLASQTDMLAEDWEIAEVQHG